MAFGREEKHLIKCVLGSRRGSRDQVVTDSGELLPSCSSEALVLERSWGGGEVVTPVGLESWFLHLINRCVVFGG